MTVVMLMLVVLLKSVESMKLMKFINPSFDHCLTSGHVQRTITDVSRLTCSSACLVDEQCQGFCFLPPDRTCLITHTDQTTVLQALQETAGAVTYFIELKEGFVRKNGNGYRLMQSSVNHGTGRQACWNLGTNMSLPKNEKESQYIREIGKGVTVWALADDDPHEGTWKNTDTDEVLTYVNWMPSEPNGGTGENCVIEATANIKSWIDVSCASSYWYICQYLLY
ncbi:hypothetical protein Pcinc_015888 [Petrolisthes cinctipes]|uniref:C-type lectin domain-containing protein n=1 Tax=Petrolisthes cinctipes TaxID=88211 RepID=A0AAE1FS48_PETCI|nr:hypothetical protein Pcinc_015888 [Petrolisthes cinctipes]